MQVHDVQDALYYLYQFVPVGGYVIFDDLMSHPGARQAWEEFQTDQNFTETIVRLDRHSAYFKKTKPVAVDVRKMRAFTDINI